MTSSFYISAKYDNGARVVGMVYIKKTLAETKVKIIDVIVEKIILRKKIFILLGIVYF